MPAGMRPPGGCSPEVPSAPEGRERTGSAAGTAGHHRAPRFRPIEDSVRSVLRVQRTVPQPVVGLSPDPARVAGRTVAGSQASGSPAARAWAGGPILSTSCLHVPDSPPTAREPLHTAGCAMSALSELLQAENSKGLSARAISQAARGLGFTLNHDTAARYLRGEHGKPDEATLRAFSTVLGISLAQAAPGRVAARRRHRAVPAAGRGRPAQPPAAPRGRRGDPGDAAGAGGQPSRSPTWTAGVADSRRAARPPGAARPSRPGAEPRELARGPPRTPVLSGRSSPASAGSPARWLRVRPAGHAAGIVKSPTSQTVVEPLLSTTWLHIRISAAAGALSRSKRCGAGR